MFELIVFLVLMAIVAVLMLMSRSSVTAVAVPVAVPVAATVTTGPPVVPLQPPSLPLAASASTPVASCQTQQSLTNRNLNAIEQLHNIGRGALTKRNRLGSMDSYDPAYAAKVLRKR